MSRFFIFCIVYVLFLSGLCTPAAAHTINYHVENRGISVRLLYGPEDPASYSSYEILGPGDTIPHQNGRTDKNGFVSFIPDRQGTWVVKVLGESEHGMHETTIEVQVGRELTMSSFK